METVSQSPDPSELSPAHQIETAPDQMPVQAEMSDGNPSLFQFASRAGRSLLSVIPAETKETKYLKGPAKIHYICDPEQITRILVSEAQNFPKSQVTKNILGSAVGNGMILSEGQVWKDQRKRYAPLFAARGLPALCEVFAETGERVARDLATKPGEVNISQMAQSASITDISRVMFSGGDTVSPERVRRGLQRYTAYIADMSLFDLMGMPPWVPRLKWLKSRAPVADMRNLAREVILTRLQERREVPEDFLDLMIVALREGEEDVEQTIDNLLTFVVAGHETAANTLTWALYLLALSQDAQEAVRSEVQSAVEEARLTYSDLEKMPLLESHVEETLRLYPAAAFFARDVAEDCDLDGLTLKQGDALFLPIYALHRHSQLWDAPDTYRLARFVDFRPQRGQFIPFGDGPRVCIGAAYAKTEIKVLLASVLQRVRVSVGSQPIPKPVVTITMHPDGPMCLEVTPL